MKKNHASGVKTCEQLTPIALAVATGSAVWRLPETAPKGGCVMILGDFGWPWPLPAVWDAFGEEWCVVTVQSSPMQDGPDNTWLEIDHERTLKRWLPMPPLPNGRDEP